MIPTCSRIPLALLGVALLLMMCPWLTIASERDFASVPFQVSEAKALNGQLETSPAPAGSGVSQMFHLKGQNAAIRVVLDLGEPMEIQSLNLTIPNEKLHTFLNEVSVGPDWRKARPLLGRRINLPSWTGGTSHIPLPSDTVGRYLVLEFSAGYFDGGIQDIQVIARKNVPERHLLFWAGDVQGDYLQKMDFLANDLKVTDIWLDYVETAFPQTNRNGSIETMQAASILDQFKRRGIRYWLGEHEGFCSLVNSPADLRDEQRWQTTYRMLRDVYSRAKAAGFHGLVMDAEDYDEVTEATKKQYADFTEHVTAWSFKEEYGPTGLYYQRGLEFGRLLKEVWGCPIIQLYEARLYADKNDARAGNYWWLKGIYDAGNTDISIATEKSYGAGNSEIPVKKGGLEFLHRWFVRLPGLFDEIRTAYPFVRRVIPGFHPWNTRTEEPLYLPKYFREQLEDARKLTTAYWIYTEGNTKAGDPREMVKKEELAPYQITADDYLDVSREFPIPRDDPR